MEEQSAMVPGFYQRLAHIETEARKLARTGQHRSYRSIEMALLGQGYREALKVFANRWTQCELDRICQQSVDVTAERARP
jgi:hypothetical protein